ncbi:MAG: YIP1 family protein [Halobacteriota archaeon]
MPDEPNRRGPADGTAVGIVWRAFELWGATLVFPWRVFPDRVRRGDQTPAMVLAVLVTGAWVAVRVVMDPDWYPVLGDSPRASVVIWALLLSVVVAPVAVHVLAAVVTVILLAVAPERAGVSESVQVVAFALAPAPLIATGVAEVQVAAALYGTGLLVYGLARVHRVSAERAMLAAVLPAYALFVLGFGADTGFVELMRRWYLI